jgi:hypothetical protein
MQALISARAVVPRTSPAAQRSQDLALTRQQFEAWRGEAAPEDWVVYHRGYLAVDRVRGSSRLSEPARRELVAVANLALALAEQGEIHLAQRRHRDGDYSYLAVLACGRRLAALQPISAGR